MIPIKTFSSSNDNFLSETHISPPIVVNAQDSSLNSSISKLKDLITYEDNENNTLDFKIIKPVNEKPAESISDLSIPDSVPIKRLLKKWNFRPLQLKPIATDKTQYHAWNPLTKLTLAITGIITATALSYLVYSYREQVIQIQEQDIQDPLFQTKPPIKEINEEQHVKIPDSPGSLSEVSKIEIEMTPIAQATSTNIIAITTLALPIIAFMRYMQNKEIEKYIEQLKNKEKYLQISTTSYDKKLKKINQTIDEIQEFKKTVCEESHRCNKQINKLKEHMKTRQELLDLDRKIRELSDTIERSKKLLKKRKYNKTMVSTKQSSSEFAFERPNERPQSQTPPYSQGPSLKPPTLGVHDGFNGFTFPMPINLQLPIDLQFPALPSTINKNPSTHSSAITISDF